MKQWFLNLKLSEKTLIILEPKRVVFFKESNLFAVMRVKGDLNTVFSGSTRSGLSTAEDFVEKVGCCTQFGI